MTKPFILTGLAVFLLVLQAGAQNTREADSLRAVIQKGANDSLKVQAYYSYGELFEASNPDSAIYYYDEGVRLAKKINSPRGIAGSCSYYIVILNNQGRFREALEKCKEALALYQQYGNTRDLCRININLGSEWQYLSDFQAAADHYLKGKKLAEELGDKRLQRVVNNNLASVFNSLSQFEKGKSYAQSSLELARELKDEYAIASSTINLAVSETSLKQNKEAIAHFREVYQLGVSLNDSLLQMDGWLGIGDNYRDLGQYDSAGHYYEKTIQLSTNNGYREYELYGYLGYSTVLTKTRQFARAEQATQKGISLAKELGSQLELKDLYFKAAELYEADGKYREALTYRKNFEILNDSLLSEKNRANVNLMEIRFETDKKESTIRALENEKKIQELNLRQKTILNTILWISASALLALITVLYLLFRQKQKLQKHRIAELEKEKQLAAAAAVLQGQEEERSRLARDLHDSMGGMLSGIKNSFTNMKDTMIMTPENLQRFEKGLSLLDISINEFRRVAHNMMPEALQKFGLNAALRDFCAGLNSGNTLRVIYQSYEMENIELPIPVSTTIYRVVQELLNNTLKHAQATEAIVQVSKEGSKLLITVEDNGKGFTPSDLEQVEGIGWANIRNRVNFLKGKIDMHSAPGEGTSVNIEIDL